MLIFYEHHNNLLESHKKKSAFRGPTSISRGFKGKQWMHGEIIYVQWEILCSCEKAGAEFSWDAAGAAFAFEFTLSTYKH